MNRPIKFRAWVKSAQRMVSPHSLYNILKRTDELADLVPEEDIIWMQFTGLKDKNGTDIYEGDVLSPNAREVLFIDNGLFDKGVGFYTLSHNDEYPTIPFTFGITQAEVSEVIGNVFENGDLLNERTYPTAPHKRRGGL